MKAKQLPFKWPLGCSKWGDVAAARNLAHFGWFRRTQTSIN